MIFCSNQSSSTNTHFNHYITVELIATYYVMELLNNLAVLLSHRITMVKR